MEIKVMQEQKTASIRTTTSLENISGALGEIYSSVAAYLARIGTEMAGPPFVIYYNMDMQALDIEAGFPVATTVPEEAQIIAGSIPGGRMLYAEHKGPYTTLESTYMVVMAHIAQEGLQTTPWMFESYLNSPDDTAPENLLTGIYFPLL